MDASISTTSPCLFPFYRNRNRTFEREKCQRKVVDEHIWLSRYVEEWCVCEKMAKRERGKLNETLQKKKPLRNYTK